MVVLPQFYWTQESIPFKKQGLSRNLITGNKFGYEIPFHITGILSSDDYELEEDPKNPAYFGVGAKITLKNGWGRGVGLGLGVDYCTNNYVKLNAFLDLDFLFAYSIPMNEKLKFTPSMFSKFELSKVLATVNGQAVQEYYLSFNVFKLQIGRIAGEMGNMIGLFRNKRVPYFADSGLYYRISFIISK